MATSRNDITGDAIASRTSNKNYADNYDNIFPEKKEVLDDGHGNQWTKCGKRCWMEITRPGKVQCNKPSCIHLGESND